MSSKASKRLVPELRFSEFGEAGNWDSKPLKDLAEVVLGSSPSSEAYNSDAVGIPFMQGNADIKDGVSAPRLFTKQITKECQIGDTLLGVRAPVGSVAKSRHHACIGRGLAAIRMRPPNAQEYIYQWLLSFEPQWQKISQGGTFYSINGDDIRGLSVAVPHESKEQQKIADCLSSIDNLIIAQAQKIAALKAHKKGLMQQLFPAEGETAPRLRFSEFQKTHEWKNQKASSVLRKTSRPVTVDLYKNYTQIGIRSHGKGIFHKEAVTGEQLGNKRVFWVVDDALVVNIVFAWEQAVAKTTNAENGMIASHRFPMYKTKDNKLSINFIVHFFLTNKGKHLLALASPGGAGRNKTLGQKEFENLEFLIPENLEEQIKIADCLSSLEALV